MLSIFLLLTSVVTGQPTAAAAGASDYRFLGRVNPATKELTWPGTGVSFTFDGTSATINLAKINGDNSFDMIVDGARTSVISKVSETSISTPKLAKGKHSVVLRRRSEAEQGTITIGDVVADGSFIAEKVASRQIDIIGDSITVGYGLDGNDSSCRNNAAVTNNPKTYGVLAADALEAEYQVIAWSGKGLVRNIQGAPATAPLVPELYLRYGANDKSDSYTFPASWKPSAVVIALGTNDWSYLGYDGSGKPFAARERLDNAVFTAGMVKFVKSITAHYPAAHFFLVSSPNLSDYYPEASDAQKSNQVKALKDAVTQLKSDKVHFVDWPTQGSEVGCDYHPNAATNAAQSKVLAAAIRSALKW